jgi:hypothetical protein
MVRLVALLSFAAMVVLAPSGARGTGIRERHPNLISGELGGRSLLLGAGYERYLTNRIGVGAGVGFCPIIDIFGSGGDKEIWTFPIYLSFLPFGEVHSLYSSAGLAYVHGDDEAGLAATLSCGYQLQSEHGFCLRLMVNGYMGSADLMRDVVGGQRRTGFAIPGLAIGVAF